jgi:putative phosphoribosyl transferase
VIDAALHANSKSWRGFCTAAVPARDLSNLQREVTSMTEPAQPIIDYRSAHVPTGQVILEGNLNLPQKAVAVVLFAHGSGSGRHSPRNRRVADVLNEAGLATLLIDLLTPEEEDVDLFTAELRFNIGLLARRLVAATEWLTQCADTRHLPIGCFGASTGGAAALEAAAQRPSQVGAVVSRGGRPDLARTALPRVRAPTLLIVGGNDLQVLELNQEALRLFRCEKDLAIVPGAGHLFEEPGALDEVARLARLWFLRHLSRTI